MVGWPVGGWVGGGMEVWLGRWWMDGWMDVWGAESTSFMEASSMADVYLSLLFPALCP